MTIAGRIIDKQKKELKKAHNKRIIHNGNEYRLLYRGGPGEWFDIDVRPNKKYDFVFHDGFYAYDLYTAEEVIARACNMLNIEI